MTASLKFYFNLRPNSTGMNPHKLTPRENTAIWEENWHLSQKSRTFSPVHAGWLSSTEVRYNRSRWTPIDRHGGLDSWIHHHSPCAVLCFHPPCIRNTAYKRQPFCLAGGKSFQLCYFSVYPNKYKDAFLFRKELLLLFESMLLPKQTSYF